MRKMLYDWFCLWYENAVLLFFLFATQKDETARLKLCGSIFEKLLHQKAFRSILFYWVQCVFYL